LAADRPLTARDRKAFRRAPEPDRRAPGLDIDLLPGYVMPLTPGTASAGPLSPRRQLAPANPNPLKQKKAIAE